MYKPSVQSDVGLMLIVSRAILAGKWQENDSLCTVLGVLPKALRPRSAK